MTEAAGIEEREIEQVVLAAFGAELNRGSARAIASVPPLALDWIQQVANAASSGARRMLVDAGCRADANRLLSDIRYVELTGHPAFQDRFTLALALRPDPWNG